MADCALAPLGLVLRAGPVCYEEEEAGKEVEAVSPLVAGPTDCGAASAGTGAKLAAGSPSVAGSVDRGAASFGIDAAGAAGCWRPSLRR